MTKVWAKNFEVQKNFLISNSCLNIKYSEEDDL